VKHARKLRRETARQPSYTSAEKAFSKWKMLAASLALIGTCLLTPHDSNNQKQSLPSVAQPVPKDNRAKALPQEDTVRRITFQSALRNPDLRQGHLDQIRKTLELNCIGAVIYDPTGEKGDEDLMARVRHYEELGLGHLIDWPAIKKELLGHDRFMGSTQVPLDMIGGQRHRIPMFAGDRLFSNSQFMGNPDNVIAETISVHEESHACDTQEGLELDGRRFTYEELAILGGLESNSGSILTLIGELKAYGAQLERCNLKALRNRSEVSTVSNVVKHYDWLIVTEMRDSDALKGFFHYIIPSRKEAIERIKQGTNETTDNLRITVERAALLHFEKMILKIEAAGLLPWDLNDVIKLEPLGNGKGKIKVDFPRIKIDMF